MGAVAGDVASDVLTARIRAKAQHGADREIDLAKAPFTSTADYDTSPPLSGKILLDRVLTREEQAALEAIPIDSAAFAKVWEFLRPLGGRLLRYPTSMLQPPANFDPGAAIWLHSTTFKMNLFSERTTQLSITDMRAVNVSCQPSSAKTVVESLPQGEAQYAGVLFDLTVADSTPFVTDAGSDQGQPYFSRRKIDLGDGMSPGGLRVEAAVKDQSCSWEIEARYRDSTQQDHEVTLRDGDKPFFSEALPKQPEQYWTIDFQRRGGPALIPCHEMPKVSACTQRAEANAW
ncbi:hypothetical protein [Micromonospora sp. RP3T]|uniref:hypothetical protein n=1 Tax=Micromonospora sp. RP3T TaxID=2135446 RepID=UPI003D7159AB